MNTLFSSESILIALGLVVPGFVIFTICGFMRFVRAKPRSRY